MKYVTDLQFWVAWIIAAFVVGLVVRTLMR